MELCIYLIVVIIQCLEFLCSVFWVLSSLLFLARVCAWVVLSFCFYGIFLINIFSTSSCSNISLFSTFVLTYDKQKKETDIHNARVVYRVLSGVLYSLLGNCFWHGYQASTYIHLFTYLSIYLSSLHFLTLSLIPAGRVVFLG